MTFNSISENIFSLFVIKSSIACSHSLNSMPVKFSLMKRNIDKMKLIQCSKPNDERRSVRNKTFESKA